MSAEVGEQELVSKDAQHGDRKDRVDEHAVAALKVHRARSVGLGVLALTDIAAGRFHRDHVPGEQCGELQEQEKRVPGEETAPVGHLERVHVGAVEVAREQGQDRQERQRDHREQSENRGEEGAESDAQVGGDEQTHRKHRSETQREVRHRNAVAEQLDRVGLVREAKEDGKIGAGKQHVYRHDRHPSDPIHPVGEAVYVRIHLWQPVLERVVGICRSTTGAVGEHGRQFGDEQTQQPARQRPEDEVRDGGRTQSGKHRAGDPGDQDRSGQPDYECAPPVGVLGQVALGVVIDPRSLLRL
jgi:hypothetical protein